jgi:short-subunit dehydrogenase
MKIKEVVCAQADGTHAYMITQIKGYLQNVLIMNIGFGYIGKISPKSELRIKFEIEVDIFGLLLTTKSEKKFSEKSLDFYI